QQLQKLYQDARKAKTNVAVSSPYYEATRLKISEATLLLKPAEEFVKKATPIFEKVDPLLISSPLLPGAPEFEKKRLSTLRDAVCDAVEESNPYDSLLSQLDGLQKEISGYEETGSGQKPVAVQGTQAKYNNYDKTINNSKVGSEIKDLTVADALKNQIAQ